LEARKLSFSTESVTIGGKTSVIERQTVGYGLPYAFNQKAKSPIEWEDMPLAIRQRLEAQLGIKLQQGIGNRYGSPSAYIGSHRDASTIIGGESVEPRYVISLSLGLIGSNRKMVFIPASVGMKQPTIESMSKLRDALVIDLEPGSLIMFSNIVNQTWKHAIPIDKTASGERISFTFREF
jgi:alkylated DNA repair dioxygenase AlkB